MSDKFDKLEAEAEARRILKLCSFTAPPICPFTIAQKNGILVKQKDSAEVGVSGFLMRVGQEFGIQYAKNIDNEGYIRFTIAHELGHYFLPGHCDYLFPNGDGIHKSMNGFFSTDRYERQADYFATVLLMPDDLFKSKLNKAGQGFSAIEDLSKTFLTSITSTAIRYAQLNEGLAAIILSEGKRINFCFMSEKVKNIRNITWIKRGDFLAKNTATALFNATKDNVIKANKTSGSGNLDDWFDGAPDIEIIEDVVGLGSYGKTLTVLYSNDDIDEDQFEGGYKKDCVNGYNMKG